MTNQTLIEIFELFEQAAALQPIAQEGLELVLWPDMAGEVGHMTFDVDNNYGFQVDASWGNPGDAKQNLGVLILRLEKES